jgi:hypothetical protein
MKTIYGSYAAMQVSGNMVSWQYIFFQNSIEAAKSSRVSYIFSDSGWASSPE